MFNETLKSKRATIVLVLGVSLLLAGLIGFFNDPVLGLFRVDNVHNLVHIVSGLAAIFYGSKNFYTAKRFGLAFAAVYGLVTLLGFLTINQDKEQLLGIMEMNPNDNYLHLLITLVSLAIGLYKGSNNTALNRK